ncbi:hypothetical protein BrevBR_16130 [Brevundimonas sp. BR2-1]|uniref:hypothetical protein n=1 Tax=Brevundimonas sp. BR2-1 TaxID=3031123 RepID=UPI0030B26D35
MIVITGSQESPEYEAAQAVASALATLWPGLAAATGEEELVSIAAGVKIGGYRVSDIDIVIAARLRPGRAFAPRRVIRTHDGQRVTGAVKVQSFIAVIEVKDHDPARCQITGDSIQVRYNTDGPGKWSSATDQNINQLHSLKAYFSDQQTDVFVNRAVMMRGFDQPPCSGSLGGTFDGAGVMTALCEMSPVLKAGKDAVLRAAPAEAMDRVLAAPIFRQMAATSLDRRRMDRIVTRNPDIDVYLAQLGSRMLRFRGRGGTGKTVMLLQLAWRAFDQRAARSLVLTYNHALTSDIRRLLALMNVPSDPAEGGIGVRTVMSFVTGWLGQLGLADGSGEWLGDAYERQCAAALEMIRAGALTPADIEAVKLSEPDRFAFDYIIADEAQDWPAPELELIKALYSPERLCLADGVDQLVRGGSADWERGVPEASRVTIPLKRCLRMKANLAVFANTLADRAGVNWKVEPNREAGGGRVIITTGPLSARKNLIGTVLADAASAGNAPVDCLAVVPPGDVTRTADDRESRSALLLRDWGYEVWDGSSEVARRDFPRSADSLRVVQYASCRGLEGWTVCLEGLDQFWLASQNGTGGPAGSGSRNPQPGEAAAAAWRQVLIPLSRAIDTLVIHLADPESEASATILGAARQHPDFVEITF